MSSPFTVLVSAGAVRTAAAPTGGAARVVGSRPTPESGIAVEANARSGTPPPAPQRAEQLAADLARVAPTNASLRFRVDPDADRVVVSVVDAETGDVLRQIPSEEALAMARRLADSGSGIVRDRA